ncbi:DUF2608 domain-containing protein [Halobacteriovorax sp. XZX-3]|uniref:DUF2608 domain-containing protein n=1 Tax=unclassified Halobacteriovorax TaxID=2639665 RepID=UPI001304AFF5|nr:DUF2608 domain-containing protein [Halobacteriovorax sp. DA5]
MKYIISILIAFSALSYQEIASHSDFYKKIVEYTKKNKLKTSDVLVVYDIDNTLLRFKTSFGSDQWYNWQKEQINNGCPVHCIAKSVNEMLEYSYKATFISDMILVEKEIPRLIEKLQETGYGVTSITSRGPVNYPATVREMNKNGINLNKVNAPRLPFMTKLQGREVRYADGIFMTSGLNKGQMLTHLINRPGINKKYKAVFFLDDRLKHMKSMDKEYKNNKANKLAVFAYRLTTTDAIVKEFNESDKKLEIRIGEEFKKLNKDLN